MPEPENPVIENNLPRKPLGMIGRVLLSLLAGTLLALSFPPLPMPFLLPLAFALLLGVIEGLPPRYASYLGFACGMTFFGIALFWLTNIFHFSAIGLWAICAAFPMLFCGCYTWLRQRLPQVPIWLLAPILWTGIEVFRSEFMIPAFPHLGLGYALVNTRLLSPLASVLGSYSLTFFVVLCGAAFGRITLKNVEKSPMIPSLLLMGWLGIFYYGFREKNPPEPIRNNPLRIQVVQAPTGDTDSLFNYMEQAAATHAQIVLWPEDSLVDPMTDKTLRASLTSLVQKQRCYLVFGARVSSNPNDPAAFRKTAYALDPNGDVAGEHTKVHPIPFFKDGEAGRIVRAIPTALGKIGVAICYDMDFPDVARRLVEDGAAVFLIPSDNPPEWGIAEARQHRQLFQMRAIECGRWLANADVGGNTYMVTPQGRALLLYADTNKRPAAFTDNVGRDTNLTPYVRGGWRFSQLCLLATLALILAGIFAPRRQNRQAN